MNKLLLMLFLNDFVLDLSLDESSVDFLYHLAYPYLFDFVLLGPWRHIFGLIYPLNELLDISCFGVLIFAAKWCIIKLFFLGGPVFSCLFFISSVNLALMTAKVRLSKKKAPMKIIGQKQIKIQVPTDCIRATIIAVHPSIETTWNTQRRAKVMLSKFVAPFAGFSLDFAQ